MSEKKDKKLKGTGLNIYQKSKWFRRIDPRADDPIAFHMLFPDLLQIKGYRSLLTSGRSDKIPIGGRRRRKNEVMELEAQDATRYLFEACLLEIKGIEDNEGNPVDIKNKEVFDAMFPMIYSHAEDICAQLINTDDLDETDLKN